MGHRAALLPLLALSFLPAVSARAAIEVSIAEPEVGQVVPGDLFVRASVLSPFDLQSVTARVGETDFPLAYGCAGSCEWSATIELAPLGLAPGDTPLLVTALDVFDGVGEASRSFVWAPPPLIEVVEPTSWAVARPELAVRASCQDVVAAPCVSFTLFAQRAGASQGQTLVSTTAQIDELVDLAGLPPGDGSPLAQLTFQAVGVSGTPAELVRTIYVEPSLLLAEVERVPGVIEAADESRVLYEDEYAGIWIRDRASQTDTLLLDLMRPPGEWYPYLAASVLTPDGAIFSTWGPPPAECPQPESEWNCLFEWRDETLAYLGGIDALDSLARGGNWAIWNEGGDLLLRDLAAGTDEVVANGALDYGNSVAENGDVVYATASPFEVHRIRSGVDEPIAAAADKSFLYPRTDGDSVVYAVQDSTSETPYQIELHGPSGVELLSAGTDYSPVADRDYRIRSGWVAFTRPSPAGLLQVWLRDPLGQTSQKSFYASNAAIRSLGPGAQLSFTAGGRHWLVPAGAPAGFLGIDIGADAELGTGILADGLHVHLGGSLFRVLAPEPGPALSIAAAWLGLAARQRLRRSSRRAPSSTPSTPA